MRSEQNPTRNTIVSHVSKRLEKFGVDFIRRLLFFPKHGEDVDVPSVVYCHFRQVCVSVNRRVFVVIILCVACLFTWFYTKVSTVQRNNRCSSTHWFDLCFD